MTGQRSSIPEPHPAPSLAEPVVRFPGGFRRTMVHEVSVTTIVLALLVCVSTSIAMQVIRYDAEPAGWVYPLLLSSVLLGIWLAVEQLWRPSPLPPLTRFALRLAVIGGPVVVLGAVTHLGVGLTAAEPIVDRSGADSLAQNVLLMGMTDVVGILMGGLAGLLVVLLPVWLQRDREAFSRMNFWSTKREDRRANWLAGHMLIAVMILTFVVPTLIVAGSSTARASSLGDAFGAVGRAFSDPHYLGDLAWVLGVLLIPVLVTLMVLAGTMQRLEPGMSRAERSSWWGRGPRREGALRLSAAAAHLKVVPQTRVHGRRVRGVRGPHPSPRHRCRLGRTGTGHRRRLRRTGVGRPDAPGGSDRVALRR